MDKAKHILDYIDMKKKSHAIKSVITYNNSQLEYSKLLQKAQAISNILLANGIKSGDIIAIYLPRSIETIISIFAVILTGCAYVPIDIRSPQQRIKYILNDALPTCIITRYNLVKNLPSNEYNIFDIAKNQYQYQSNKKGNKIKSNILYAIYTSGSTGLPKGVLGTHEGLINRIEWMQSTYPILESDISCFNTSPSFVDSVAEIFSPLATGTQLHIMSNESAGNLELLVKEIYNYRVTRLLLGPAVLQMLLNEVDNIQNMFSYINFFAVSGEEITIQIARKFRKLFPKVRFVNLYGSTEVAADALYYEIPSNLENLDRIPIGKPIKNIQVSLLYDDNVLASNSRGEICLCGIGVAQGYLNVTKIGSDKFIIDDSTGSLAYRTGDIGYFSEDKQTLMYLGRQDDQIKINGQKIHLKEIERVALNHENIKDVAVVTSEIVPIKIVMYAVMKNNLISNSIESIRNHMKQHVPEYMIPNLIVSVEEIPQNTNGKKDYYLMHKQATEGIISPLSSDTTKNIIELFKYIFKTDDIGLDTDFFAMGGNSLIASMFCSKLNKIFDILLDISVLYKLRTVQNISEYIEKQQISLLSHQYQTNGCIKRQNKTTEDVLVFLPPLLGYPYCYYELSKYINRYTVYLLGEDSINVKISNSLKDMAALYAKYIVSNIKAKKFKLIGWSFGGILAYECAIKLQSMGKKISEVILLDSYNPVLFSNQDQETEKQEIFNFINTKINNFDTQLIQNTINRNINFLWQHIPSQSNFKIILVKASSYNYLDNYITAHSDNGWNSCSSEKIVIVSQECDHFDMLNTENIPFLLDLLQN